MSATTNATSAPSKLSTTTYPGSQVSILLPSIIFFPITASITSLKLKTLRNACSTVFHCHLQESSEEKTQQMKERLSRLFEANERRCSRSVLYGSELLQACSLSSEPAHAALTAGGWRWVGRESCLRAQRTCVGTTSALQSTLLSVKDRLLTANSLIKR